MSQFMSGKQMMNMKCSCVADIWILTVLNCLSDFCGLLCLLTRKMLNEKSVDESFTEVHNLKSLLKGIRQNRAKT